HTVRMDPGLQSEYVGFEHLRELVGADEVLWKASRNSLTWAVVARLVGMPRALALALLLYRRVPFARFFRTVWFTPVVMSYRVVGVIWLWVYNYDWAWPISRCARSAWARSRRRGSRRPAPRSPRRSS